MTACGPSPPRPGGWSGVRLLRDSGRTRLRWSQSRYASCWVFSAVRCTDLRGTRCTQVLERAASVEPLATVEGDRREGAVDHRALPAGDVRRPCCAAADTLPHYNLLIMFNASIVTQRAAKLSPTMRAAFASLMLSPSPVDRTVTVLMPIRAASHAHVHGKACETPAINLYVTVVTVHLPPAAPLTCANDPQCRRGAACDTPASGCARRRRHCSCSLTPRQGEKRGGECPDRTAER